VHFKELFYNKKLLIGTFLVIGLIVGYILIHYFEGTYSTVNVIVGSIRTILTMYWWALLFFSVLLCWALFFLMRRTTYVYLIYTPLFLLFAGVLTQTLSFISPHIGKNIPDVSDVVGFANYYGYFKDVDFTTFWIAIIGGSILTYLLVIFFQAFKKNKTTSYRCISSGEKKSVFSWFPLLILLLIYAILNFPYFNFLLEGSGMIMHADNYDAQNLVTWQYLKHLGFIPMKDFWYPYGGFFYSSLAFPPEALLSWIHNIVLFGVLAFSVCKNLNYRKIRIYLIILSVWLLQLITGGTHRYFLGLSIVLFFAACIKIVNPAVFFLLGLYAGYAFFMEPVQLLYAAPACLLLLAISFILQKQRAVKASLVRGYFISFITLTVVIGVYVYILALQGALAEYLKFYMNLDLLGIYGMSSAMQAYHSLSLLGVYWWLTFTLLIFSLHTLFSRPKKDLKFEDFLPLGIALLNIMIFQKCLLRPFNNSQGMGVAIIGFLFLIAQSDLRGFFRNSFIRYSTAFVVGISIIMIVKINNPLVANLGAYAKRPLTIRKDVMAVFAGTERWAVVKKNYFSQDAFQVNGVNGKEFRDSVLKKINFEKKDDLFVLGDDSYLYILFQQLAPFYITLYNQSILYSQQNTVDWLTTHNPGYVLWKKSFEKADGVPNIVRAPLIYEKVINNYKYSDKVGSFLILRRSDSGTPVDLDFWREQLGDILDLGFIPSQSNPERFIGKKEGAISTGTFLTVLVDNPMHGRSRDVALIIKNKQYTVHFLEYKDKKTYRIHLERLWFWEAAKKNGITPRLLDDQNGTIHINTFPLSREILY